MNGEGKIPRLSVIVVSFNGPELLERCLSSLEWQTLQEGIEILVVLSQDVDKGEIKGMESRFPKVKWTFAPRDYNVAQMRALGIVNCQGEIVALLEDDCVVNENWCAALLNLHEGPYAAVGGAVDPGPYRGPLDWGLYFSEYSGFMSPFSNGEADALPGTNVSYKRTVLAQLAEDGRENFVSQGFYEFFVHDALQKAGFPLKLDSNLVVRNVNSWNLSKGLKARFHHGRGYAGLRVAGKPLWGRIPFLGLALLLPVIQLGRIERGVIARKRYVRELAVALPWVFLFSVSWSVGEFMGYLLGPGDSLQRWR